MEDKQIGVLEDYLKKGLEKGFSINHIKDVLIQHGHKKEKVEIAANNIMGMKYPDKLKAHLDKESPYNKQRFPVGLTVFVVILLIIIAFFAANYFVNRTKAAEVKSQLEEVQKLGLSIDDLSTTLKEHVELAKQKDLTIEEKQSIIDEQIKTIETINSNIEAQRNKLKEILLDIMNRMIGRMSE